jgi:hypothetical protein
LSRRAHRRTPAAGDPPPCGASQHDRRSHLPSHLCSPPVAPASRRASSRPKPWPLAPFCNRRRTSGEVPAGRRRGSAWRRRRALTRDHNRRSQPTAQIKRMNPPLPRSTVDQWTWSTALVYDRARRPIQDRRHRSPPARSTRCTAGHFMKNPLSSLLFCPNPSTFKRSLHISPVFIVLTPDLLENPTRGP